MTQDTGSSLFSGLKGFILRHTIKWASRKELAVYAQQKGVGQFSLNLEVVAETPRAADLAKWKTAVTAATDHLYPDITLLQDLYRSAQLDMHLCSILETRILRVMESKFKLVDKDGQTNEELTRQFQRRWFNDWLKAAMESMFWGVTLVSFEYNTETRELSRIQQLPRKHVKAWKKIICQRQSDQNGFAYTSPEAVDWFMQIGDDRDLGMMKDILPIIILKKYAMGAWSSYTEKFGVPFRMAKTPSGDKTRRNELADILASAGDSGWAVMNLDEELQVMHNPNSGSQDLFDKFISALNSEMSKRILGQDGTTDNKNGTGTYGSLKVLSNIADGRHEADRTVIKYLIQDDLFPKLKKHGYKLDGVRFEWDDFKELEPLQVVDMAVKLADHFELDHDFITKRTGVPIIGVKQDATKATV